MDVVIVGAGGLGREVLQWSRATQAAGIEGQNLNVVGFVDDEPGRIGTFVHNLPVLGDIDWLANRPKTAPRLGVLVAIGSTVVKHSVVERLRGAQLSYPTLIHHTAIIGDFVEIGRGSIICPGVTISTDIVLGSFCTVDRHATIGHDVRVGDFATLAPCACISGNVTLGTGAQIFTSASVIPGVSVGDWTIVGAGATVITDLPSNCTAVGTPAKALIKRGRPVATAAA
jgi:sugar O-acyltransferase (sialic acid O-acetyltransferase NeuD family)